MRDILSARGVETELLERLKRIEDAIGRLTQKRSAKDWYSVGEAAEVLERAAFTVREWCRLGRICASKRRCGRGNSLEWMISHAELNRVQNEGLLPRERNGDATNRVGD
jgi:hypothetical protein